MRKYNFTIHQIDTHNIIPKSQCLSRCLVFCFIRIVANPSVFFRCCFGITRRFMLKRKIELHTPFGHPSLYVGESSGHTTKNWCNFKRFNQGYGSGSWKRSFFCGSGSAKILPLGLPHRLFDLKINLAKKFCPFSNED